MSTPEKFCNRLARVRKSRGETQESLAQVLGYTRSYISQLEADLKQPGPHFLDKFARWESNVGGLTHKPQVTTLRARQRAAPSSAAAIGECPPRYVAIGEKPDIELPEGITARHVPLISWQAAASMQTLPDESYQYDAHIAFNVIDHRAIAVVIRGDSMMPKYEDGDVVILYPSFEPRNGESVMARLRDDRGHDLMFKLFSQQGRRVLLTSYNPAYPALEFDRGDFAWIYPVASFVRHVRK